MESTYKSYRLTNGDIRNKMVCDRVVEIVKRGGFNIKIKYILMIFFISLSLSVLTHVTPIFLPLPKWILLNIAGTFLLSYALGPIYGALYAGALNIVISSMGMGSGVVIYVLLTQMIEAGLIGILKMKKIKESFNVIMIGFILSLFMKPIGIALYAIFNGEVAWFMDNIINTYTTYLKTDFTMSLMTYLISAILGYSIYKVIDKLTRKEEEALFDEKD